jgi:hypothetical protein
MAPDGAYICEHCNAILDASFLGDDITNDEPKADDATRIKALPEADATRIKATPPKPEAPRAKAVPAKAAPARAAKGAEAEPAAPAIYVPEPKKRPTLAETAAPPPETAKALDDLLGDFRNLPMTERVTAGGALGLLVALALPWKNTLKDGDIIGLMADNCWPLPLMALLVTVAIFARRHARVRPYRDYVLQGVVALATFSLLGSLAFWRLVGVEKTLKAGGKLAYVMIESAGFGVYLGIAAAAVMLGGAVLTYLEREKLPE